MGMPSGSIDAPSERCQRCFQPIPVRARRCPECGHQQKRELRRVSLYFGVFGLVVAVVLVALGLFMHGDTPSSAAPDDSGKPAQSAPPPKEPPLNQ